MILEDKETYEAPTVQIVEVKPEGIVCISVDPYDGFDHNNGDEYYNW